MNRYVVRAAACIGASVLVSAACLAAADSGSNGLFATRVKTVAPAAATPAVKTAIKKLSARFSSTTAFSVSSSISVYNDNKSTMPPIIVSAKLQKPGSYRIEYHTAGHFLGATVSEGVSEIYVDYGAKVYSKLDSGSFDKSLENAWNAGVQDPMKALVGNILSVYSTHSPFDLTDQVKLLSKDVKNLGVSATNVKTKDLDAVAVTQKFMLGETAVTGRLLIDNKTNLPLKYTLSMVSGNKNSTLVQSFSNWGFSSTQFDKSAFAVSIPDGYKEVTTDGLLAPGQAAPDFTVNGADGKAVKLSDYLGKTVILKFWATWCPPCIESFPHFERVWQAVKDNSDIAVLAVCIGDDKDSFDKFVKAAAQAHLTFPVQFDPAGRDPEKSAAIPFFVQILPADFVIGKDGKVVAAIQEDPTDEHLFDEALAKQGIHVPAAEPAAVLTEPAADQQK